MENIKNQAVHSEIQMIEQDGWIHIRAGETIKMQKAEIIQQKYILIHSIQYKIKLSYTLLPLRKRTWPTHTHNVKITTSILLFVYLHTTVYFAYPFVVGAVFVKLQQAGWT